MMDRLLREGNPPTGQLASPKPQYKKPGVDEYAPVEGQHGAPFAILKNASGAVVSPATEATLEQVRALLSGVATEAKLEQARTLLEAISTKDFATSSKQDALNIAVEDLKSELILVKSELATIRENQLSGDQKVTLSGNKVSYVTLLNAVAFTSDASTSYSVRSLLGLTEGEFLQIKSIVFEFRDSHDKSGRLLLTARGPAGGFPIQFRIYENNAFFNSGGVQAYIGDFGEIVGNGFIQVPALGRMNFTDIQLNVKFDAPPTAGALTIKSIIKY